MKVLLKTPLSAYSGYGQDGIGLALALQRWGCDVYLQPVHCDPPLPPGVAAILTKRLEAPFDLTINHWDPGNLRISPEARDACTVAIGWTMWEYTKMAPLLRGRTSLKKRLEAYDLILGYDDVSVEALRPYVTNALGKLQGGYESRDWPAVERDWESERFGFCMHGALHTRKEPFTAIEAFNELKHEYPEEFAGATLSLKTVVPGLHPAMEECYPKLRIFYETWPDEILRKFYAANHVLLAPSRGEGKNLPALEFMSTGGTVIATDWGGHHEWMNAQYAYPLDYTIMPVDNANKGQAHNARPSKDHLKELMLHVYRNRAEVKARAEVAAKTIPAMCDWSVVLESLWRRVRDLVPEKGESIYQMAQACHRDVQPLSSGTGSPRDQVEWMSSKVLGRL